MRHKIDNWLLILSLGCFTVSCAVVNDNSNVTSAEISELHGYHDVFWPYANAGFRAAKHGDHVMAKKLYLRAYRNTGVVLAEAPAPKDTTARNMMFGQAANLADVSEVQAHADQLDALTPLPGVGLATNDVLDAAMSYRRSLATYDWARETGFLGKFEDAERAFLYSLHLEESRGSEFIASRHFELARLYDAWGKFGLSMGHYRKAFPLVGGIKGYDPIGYSMALNDFAAVLDENGKSAEASQIRKQSDELKKNNPGEKAGFQPAPYPKRARP